MNSVPIHFLLETNSLQLVDEIITFGIKETMPSIFQGEIYLARQFISDPDRAIKIEDINNTVVSWWKIRYKKKLPVKAFPEVSDDECENCLQEVKKLFKVTVDHCRKNCIRRLLEYATEIEGVRRPDGQYVSTWKGLVEAMTKNNQTGKNNVRLIVVGNNDVRLIVVC